MACSTRERLSMNYDLQLRARVRADDDLRAQGEHAGAFDYQRLGAVVHEVRIDSEIARLELEQHVAQHRCGSEAN